MACTGTAPTAPVSAGPTIDIGFDSEPVPDFRMRPTDGMRAKPRERRREERRLTRREGLAKTGAAARRAELRRTRREERRLRPPPKYFICSALILRALRCPR